MEMKTIENKKISKATHKLLVEIHKEAMKQTQEGSGDLSDLLRINHELLLATMENMIDHHFGASNNVVENYEKAMSRLQSGS